MAHRSRGRSPRRRSRTLLLIASLAALYGAALAIATFVIHPTAAGGGRPASRASAASTATPSVEASPGTGLPNQSAPPITWTSARCVNVPILVYHYIQVFTNPNNQLGYRLSVAPNVFQAQMDWLRVVGAHPVTMTQVIEAMAGGAPLPSRPVVLTFDDGYADFATAAAPILAHDGFVGTDFVISGYVGRAAYMSAQQILQVARMGMVIGAHTVHHPDLTSLPVSLAQVEIDASKQMLEQLLGRPVVDFAYPYGYVNSAVATLVANAGFRDAVTLTAGTEQCPADRYVLHRTRVIGGDSLADFAASAGVPAPPPNWQDPWPPVPASAPPTPSFPPSPR